MSSPNSNLLRMLAESIDQSPPPEVSNREDVPPSLADSHRARILRIDQDEARLAAQGCTWYEIKSSTLRESDLVSVRDKARLNELYEVVIPNVHARAHSNSIPSTKQFGFIGGNPSSHKGWMSRYFFVKRLSGQENPWNCNMSWRDDAYTLPPPTPEQKPDLAKFLEAVGDRYNRMDRAAMLEALKERKSKTKSGGASSSSAQNKEETSSGALGKDKRKASPEKKERRRKRRHEERGTGSTQESIPEVMINEPEDTTNKGPEQSSASLDFIRHLVPDQDFDQLKRTPDLEVFETAGLHFMQSLAWFGEAASRFSKARAEVIKTKRSYDGVLGRHEALLKQLEEIQTKESVEKESLSAELESARAEAQTYKAQAQSLVTQVQSLDTRAQCAEEESKLRLAEVEKLQEERANSWALEKEKFLKSKDFDSLCLKKAVMYFDKGFEGYLAQFRANGFSEEEYPAPFLDVEQALADMPEDQEEGSSGPGETPPA
ncbi:hypothetical protein F511_29152 [Dorcoceras hygrometricum]|uniref:Uncharacterized protein n=1 Tax=Dorcoceras hygrometricum TaxID=472368 RepID=A0A2Z7C4S7_9LAMI|nr:hypothetical protein F511_29152 [Dorcoceras hygrometricum]